MKRLPDEVIQEMQSILKIAQTKNDEKYKQSSFYCGTAHCFAGWKVVKDYAKAHKSTRVMQVDFNNNKTKNGKYWWAEVCDFCHNWLDNNYPDRWDRTSHVMWEYARLSWGLTYAESCRLFSEFLSLTTMEDTVKNFSKGYRYCSGEWEEGQDA